MQSVESGLLKPKGKRTGLWNIYLNNRKCVHHSARSSPGWNVRHRHWEFLTVFAKELPNCFIETDWIIRRKNRDGKTQIIIPRKLTNKVLMTMHNEQGHLGYSKTLKRTQER